MLEEARREAVVPAKLKDKRSVRIICMPRYRLGGAFCKLRNLLDRVLGCKIFEVPHAFFALCETWVIHVWWIPPFLIRIVGYTSGYVVICKLLGMVKEHRLMGEGALYHGVGTRYCFCFTAVSNQIEEHRVVVLIATFS